MDSLCKGSWVICIDMVQCSWWSRYHRFSRKCTVLVHQQEDHRLTRKLQNLFDGRFLRRGDCRNEGHHTLIKNVQNVPKVCIKRKFFTV